MILPEEPVTPKRQGSEASQVDEWPVLATAVEIEDDVGAGAVVVVVEGRTGAGIRLAVGEAVGVCRLEDAEGI